MFLAIPDWTKHGVLPTGHHECFLDEIETRFAFNAHRIKLWTSFLRFISRLQSQPNPQTLLIDGGFTSDKTTPSDIDLVLDLSNCAQDVANHWISTWATQQAAIKTQYLVDLWVYCPGFPNDLRSFFEYVRPEESLLRGMGPNERKGLLKVNL